MDFSFSEEQEMLRAGARQYLGDRFDADKVSELAQSDDGWDPSSWQTVADLGWTSLSVPEAQGGAGMGFLEEAVIFEETGAALYPGPFFATIGLALPALSGAVLEEVVAGKAVVTFAYAEPGGPATFDAMSECTTTAERSGESWTITGEKYLIPDLAAANHAVVVARGPDGLGLFLARDVEGNVAETVDATRRLGSLVFDATPVEVLAEPGDAGSVIDQIRRRSYAALALEAVGICSTALALAKEHASTREQFGKPIGVYQAVSHQISDIYADTELARSLAYWAAWCVAENDDNADTAVLAAKGRAAEAAVTACERSIQVHGGIGFTWEHILHRYYKRAEWIASFDGSPSIHRAAIADALLAN